MTRALLTGARGQLGSEIARHCPTGVILVPTTRETLDVTDPASIGRAFVEHSPELVINTAAYVRVDDAEDNRDSAFLVNASAPAMLAEACRDKGAVLLHIGTDYIFDGAKDPLPYDEEDDAHPLNVYGRSKYEGETLVRSILPEHYIVRVAGLYGTAGASGKGGNFVYTVLDRARSGQPLRVVDDMRMSPSYAPDAARMIWEIITGRKPYGIYHAANSGVCSWYEFAREIVAIAGLDADLAPVKSAERPTRARRPLWSPLVSVKGTGLRPWREGLGDFIRSVPPERLARA